MIFYIRCSLTIDLFPLSILNPYQAFISCDHFCIIIVGLEGRTFQKLSHSGGTKNFAKKGDNPKKRELI